MAGKKESGVDTKQGVLKRIPFLRFCCFGGRLNLLNIANFLSYGKTLMCLEIDVEDYFCLTRSRSRSVMIVYVLHSAKQRKSLSLTKF